MQHLPLPLPGIHMLPFSTKSTKQIEMQEESLGVSEGQRWTERGPGPGPNSAVRNSIREIKSL